MKKSNDLTQKSKSISIFYIIVGAVLFLYALIMIFALGWGVVTSLKSKADFRTNVLGFPTVIKFDNYITAIQGLSIKIRSGAGYRDVMLLEMFGNSILYAVGCAFLTTACQLVTAYVVREFPCKFSSILYGTVIACMLIPIVGSDASLMNVLVTLGIYDTIFGAWLMKSFFIGVYFLIFHATFTKLPEAYTEAAQIDGAGYWRIFTMVIFPLVKSMFLTIFLLNFISYWNDYQVPLLYLPSMPTVAYGVYEFSRSQLNELSSIPMKMTGCMLMLIPILAVFLIFNKRLMEGVSMGGIKE